MDGDGPFWVGVSILLGCALVIALGASFLIEGT